MSPLSLIQWPPFAGLALGWLRTAGHFEATKIALGNVE